jgi:ABC-type phosphate transport system permease subunit
MYRKMLTEKLVKAILFACAAFAIIVVFFIFYYTLNQGKTDIAKLLLTGYASFNSVNSHAAYYAAITTLYVAAVATLLAAAVGIPCAIYLAEFADMKFRNVTKTSIEVLDGFPSVVIGIVGWELLSNPQSSYSFTMFLSSIGMHGYSGCILFMWLILVIMSFPVIATISEDALRAVPQDLREASLGIGATKWQTTKEVLLPTATPRIVTSILLALAASMGETVAIYFVCGRTISPLITSPASLILHPLVASETLTIILNNSYASTLEGGGPAPSAFAEAFILFVIIGAVIISTRFFMAHRSGGSTERNSQ